MATCADCLYHNAAKGECRFEHPHVLPISAQGTWSGWPKSSATDWCGDYVAAEGNSLPLPKQITVSGTVTTVGGL